MIDTDIDVYEELKNVVPTNEASVNKQFILSYYQTIPKYYFMCNDRGVNAIVYNFSVGSGKTAAGLFVVSNNIETYKKYTFIKKYVTPAVAAQIEVKKNVLVIGSWVSKGAVINELFKEEFGIVSKKDLDKLRKMQRSNISEEREQAKIIKRQLNAKIESYIEFLGYQKFVNKCFPNMSSDSISQDVNVLLAAYKNNTITVDKDFQDRLKNCIIIVDEFQKLYSSQGLNTFGFAIMAVVKLAKQLNVRLVFLSGTIFNSSLSELVSIVNVVSEHTGETFGKFKTPKGLFDDADCLYPAELIDGYNTMIPTKDFIAASIKLLRERFIYYNHSQLTNEKYVGKLFKMIPVMDTSKKVRFTTKPATLKQSIISDEPMLLRFNKRTNLPVEQHIGNISVMNKEGTEYKLLLYSCEVRGVQKELYKKFLSKNHDNFSIEDDENENIISIHDAGLPPQKELLSKGIIKSSGGLIGKFLHLDNIRNYSAIGYNLVKLAIDKCTHGEKMIVYHNKLNSFGIYQYMLILGANGFVKYGESTKNNSICLHCGRTYEEHNKDLKERLAIKCCNDFHPIYYYYLIGSMKPHERETLVSDVFNNPRNLYGEILSIMFVSDVAYSGVSFLNTNNIVLLSKISNISKWTQICARIIRTKSHVMLPEERQYANIYTMVIHYPSERETFKTKFTHEQKYYLIRTLLNDSIDEFLLDFSPKTIGNELFNGKNVPTDVEKKRLNDLYMSEVKKEIQTIVEKNTDSFPAKIWTLNTFIKRLKDNKESYSYLNLSNISDNSLRVVLSNMSGVNIFKYSSDDTLYIYFVHDDNEDVIVPQGMFDYKALEAIPKDEAVFYGLLKKLDNSVFLIHKKQFMMKIMKYVGNNYKILVNQNVWWDNVFAVHDEYYEGDAEFFIENHYSGNRSLAKVAGFYYNDIIVLKDGSTKRIDYSFPVYTGWKSIPYIFKITSMALSANSPWTLHVSVVKKVWREGDVRRAAKGIICTNFDHNELAKQLHLKRSDFLNKNEFCLQLIQIVVDKQYENMEDRNVYTPFEK